MEPRREQFYYKENLHSLQVKHVWYRPSAEPTSIVIPPHSNSISRSSRSRTYDLAKIWFNLSSSRLNSVFSMTNNSIYHHGIRSDLFGVTNKSTNYKGAICRMNIRGLLLRCVPTATCLSHKSNHDDMSVTTSDSVIDLEDDSLPGVRFQRKSNVEQRVNTQISEQDISEWLTKESGMDRVRMMYAIGHDGKFIQEETRLMNIMFYRTVILGVVFNIITTSLKLNAEKKEKHLSNTQAMLKGVSNERKVLNSVLAGSMKTSLQVTVCTAILLHLSQTIAAYRNKSSVWEYAISSSLAFGLLGLGQGVKRCAFLSLRGAAVGLLGGYVVCKILASEGMNQEQRHLENIRRYLNEQKMMKPKEEPL